MVLQTVDKKIKEIGINIHETHVVPIRDHMVTPREKEVLQKISEGMTVKEIAQVLFLSTHTIDSHKKNLIEKFGARNSIDLIVKTIKLGFINI